MEDNKVQETNSPSQGSDKGEPVRSRWTPRPEQILILESIFNSGMVNPPRDETVRIRKMLEQFGTVGDTNVFYWFQNRRSRTRRRQRLIQAGLAANNQTLTDGAIRYQHTSSVGNFASSSSSSSISPPSPPSSFSPPSPSSNIVPSLSSLSSPSSSSSSRGVVSGESGVNEFFEISKQLGLTEIELNPMICSDIWNFDNSNVHYQSGLITVFINGAPSEIPRGPIDIRAMFGQDMILMHSSGQPVVVNVHGISLQGLQLGENYFLVSKRTK
ncbi:WUSCHEL related homeobox 11 [Tasmannia lanceolata]|uniref:WUSCHEL related homeobox 11 n=1 Tax=Tasmannia lanceolata TaxID=3420 RepID=UPI0040631B6E